MASTAKEYIEVRNGNYYVAGTRVSLDSIVHAFRRGESPETICQNFEILRLEEVYGAIAYYLANQAGRRGLPDSARREVDRWNAQRRTVAGQFARETHAGWGRDAADPPIVKVRFLADADLNKAIVNGLLRREPSVDFLTAQAAGMKDPEVLALAAKRQTGTRPA